MLSNTARPHARFLRTRRGLALALLLSLSQLAATVKAAPNQPPTFEIVFPNHSYTQPIASMLEFDIRNQSLDLFDAEGKTTTAARLHNGTFEERHADGSYTNINVTVQYFDFYNEHPNTPLRP